MSELSDEDLLGAIVDGQMAAMNTFYKRFERRIYHYAMSRLGNTFDAADVLNEVMMEVWRSAGRFEGRSKVSTWLYGIAHFKVVDRLRKRPETPPEELDEQMPDDSPDIESAILGAQEAGLVRKCLDSLKQAHKEAIQLAFFHDMSYEDIARECDCPPGTIKSRVYHAKEGLKRCLARMMK